MTPLPAQAGIPSDKERRRNQRIEIALSLIIGVMVGLVVVAFILLTGRLSARIRRRVPACAGC
jgi:type VI protein secretion system component VasF